jgi:hypothetical protein
MRTADSIGSGYDGASRTVRAVVDDPVENLRIACERLWIRAAPGAYEAVVISLSQIV